MSQLSRRSMLTIGAGLALASVTSVRGFAQTSPGAVNTGPFILPPLPYATNALEPTIGAQTMELHHGKHHAAFISNLNNFTKDNAAIAARPIPDILGNLESVPEAIRTGVRNNLGGHANHTMFWEIMSGDGGKADGEVLAAITRDLGGLEKMQTDFNAAGGRQFGSGWVFVTVDKQGKLAIETRPNQDSPLMDGKRVLFGNDVWEHAYYLNYQNRRADYLKSWWKVVNWKRIGERYEAAKAGTLQV